MMLVTMYYCILNVGGKPKGKSTLYPYFDIKVTHTHTHLYIYIFNPNI